MFDPSRVYARSMFLKFAQILAGCHRRQDTNLSCRLDANLQDLWRGFNVGNREVHHLCNELAGRTCTRVDEWKTTSFRVDDARGKLHMYYGARLDDSIVTILVRDCIWLAKYSVIWFEPNSWLKHAPKISSVRPLAWGIIKCAHCMEDKGRPRRLSYRHQSVHWIAICDISRGEINPIPDITCIASWFCWNVLKDFQRAQRVILCCVCKELLALCQMGFSIAGR